MECRFESVEKVEKLYSRERCGNEQNRAKNHQRENSEQSERGNRGKIVFFGAGSGFFGFGNGGIVHFAKSPNSVLSFLRLFLNLS